MNLNSVASQLDSASIARQKSVPLPRQKRRLQLALSIALGVTANVTFFGVSSAQAQNTLDTYSGGSGGGSLLVTSNWSLGILPTVAHDAVLATLPGTRTLTAGNLTVGSFNVTATSSTYSIQNQTTTATNSILTLGGAGNLGNSVSGTAADLLYNATGSTFNIIGANGSSGSGVLLLVLGQSGNFNINGNSTISAAISGNFGFNKTGAGTLNLSGINTYTGLTNVYQGTVTVAGNQTGMTGGWYIAPLAGENVLTRAVTFNAGSTIVVPATNAIQLGYTTASGQSSTLNVSGSVTNNGPLNNQRGGVLNINSGGVWSQTGTMQIAAPSGSGVHTAMTVATGGSFTYNAATPISLTPAFNAAGNATLTISGTGVFTTNQGFVNTLASTTGAGLATITLTGGGTLKLSDNIPQLLSANGTSFINIALGSGSSGTIDTNGFNTTIDRPLTSSGATGLVKNGAGTLTFTVASPFQGGTTINGGTIKLAPSAPTSPIGNAATTIAVGGTLDLNGNTPSTAIIGNVLRGTITNTSASPAGISTFTSSSNNMNGSFTVDGTGPISFPNLNSVAGAAIVKNGDNALTLSGSGDNAFVALTVNKGTVYLNKGITATRSVSGPLVINGGGRVEINANGGDQILNDAAATVTVNNGTFDINTRNETITGTLQIGDGTNSGAITGTTGILTNQSTIDARSGSSTAILAGAVDLNKTTSGTVTLSAVNTYTGATTVTVGKLSIASTGRINTSNGVNINGGNFNYSSATPLAPAINFSSGTLSGTGTINSLVTVPSGAYVAPGDSPGTMTFTSGLTLNAGSTFNWEHNAGNAVGTASTNWDVANITGGSFTADSTASTGSKLALYFDTSTSFSDTFWNSNQAWTFITGGVSGSNYFDASNISVYVNNVLASTTGQGSFSTVVSGSDLQLQWTASTGGGSPNFSFTNTSDVVLNVLKNSTASTTKTIQNTGDASGTASLANTNSNLSVTGSLTIGAGSSAVQTLVPLSTSTTGTTSGTLTVTTNSGGSNVINTTVNVGSSAYATGGGVNSSTTFGPASTAQYGVVSSLPNLESSTVAGVGGATPIPALAGSTATILKYDNSATGGTTETISMAWRTRTAAEANPSQPNALLSDVVNLTGMLSGTETQTPAPTASGTGLFVLQMSYAQSTLDALGLNETSIAISGELRLGWNDAGTWKTAVLGNVGVGSGSGTFLGAVAYDPNNPAHNVLGAYGVDPSSPTGGVVWAVLNHNSEFAVIPEPSTLVAGGLAMLGFSIVGLRKRRKLS